MVLTRRPPLKSEKNSELRDRPVRWLWRLPILALLPLVLISPFLLSGQAERVEEAYSRGIYPYVSSLLGLMSDWAAVSLAEIFLLALVVWVFLVTSRGLAEAVRGQRSVGNVALHGLARTATLVSALVGAWFFLWGVNYHRLPFAVSAELEVAPREVGELVALCEEWMDAADSERDELALDPGGGVVLAEGREECLARVATGFRQASAIYPVLDWNYARPKQAVLSPLLSRLGITGIYSPLTGEPHVNRDVTDVELPFTAAHEMAHQIGFGREDEANFLALIACREHPDADFRYSGALEGFLYAMNALSQVDVDSYGELWEDCPEGVRFDLEANAENWMRFESPARDVARKVNDTYLKTAGEQPQGVESYGAVVDLMLAERRR